MSSTPSRIRTILPTSGRTALGATVAGGLLTGLASAPERISRLFRHRFPIGEHCYRKIRVGGFWSIAIFRMTRC